MGYRGEDVSRTPADWGQQAPRQSSPGVGQGNAGSWVDGQPAPGYGNGDYDGYAPDGSGYGYQGGDGYGGYPQQEQGPYGGHDAYGSQPPYAEPGYAQPEGYGQAGDYGYQQPVDQYGQPGHFGQPEPGYRAPGGGQDYPAVGDGYGQSGGYPARHASGAYPALPDGGDGYQGGDAGNDWYGGQPAAASGAGFADTGTYALDSRVIEDYGTGQHEAMRTPGRGYPPASGQPQGRPQLPGPAQPVISGPQAVPRTGAQERYDDYDSYPGYGHEQQQDRTGGSPTGGYPAAGRNPTGEYPTTVGNPTGGYPAAGRNPTGEYPTTVGNPTGGYPAAGRNPTGGYPAAGRNPTGGYPATGRDDYDAYTPDAYGQDFEYGDAGPGGRASGAGYDNPAVGYDDYPAGDDPYQDAYGAGKGGRGKTKKGAAGKGGRPGGPSSRGGGRRPRTLALAAGAVFVVVVAAAAYFLVLKPHSTTPNPDAGGRLPTAGASPSNQACVQQYGTYCHIELRSLDTAPLTLDELYPPVVNNEADGNGNITSSFTLETTKLTTSCAGAVIGQDLISSLKSGQCTQVLRASYLSGDGKIMGTIGVINLSTTNDAHYAGKLVGQNDFIAPLASSKGVASKLGQGTGVVEAQYKGHYLILTWSEFVNGTTPSTTAEDNQLEQFSSDLVAGTANINLSERMVSGDTAADSQ
jgi:hypothetical protein